MEWRLTDMSQRKKKKKKKKKLLGDLDIPTSKRSPRNPHHPHRLLDVTVEMGLKPGRHY
jgi:hypothetical protein